MKLLWDLYLTFFVMGATTFGGGYAMLPLLEKVVSGKKKWATEEELGDYFAMGQCTPGVISVNVATFIGMKCAGVKGALVATLGLVTPPVLIISAIAGLFQEISANESVESAFMGLKIGVAVLIGGSAAGFVKKAMVDTLSKNLCILVFSIMVIGSLLEGGAWLDLASSPMVLVVTCGVIGLFFSPNKKNEKGEVG